MALDNRKTPIQPHNITINLPIENSVEYICINCTQSFWVYDQYNHTALQPNQTLFCQDCVTHLKNCIIREKNQDYGW